MLSPIFRKIIQILDSFPEIGPRQAWRLFFWFVKQDKNFKNKFIEYFQLINEKLNFCQNCNFPVLDSLLCEICSNEKRDKSKICIVARETDLITIESLKKFKGVYYLLGGLLLPFENKELIEKNIKKLKEKLDTDPKIKEIILALPLTRDAEPTRKILLNLISKYNKIKIKTPKMGIPTGGEIEFLDPETLKEALEL